MNKIYKIYEKILNEFVKRCREKFEDNLISIAVFGSVARGTVTKKSDIDVLLVVKNVGKSIGERLDLTLPIVMEISKLHGKDIYEHILTPEEVMKHPSILLDLTQDVKIIFDKENFLSNELGKIRDKLNNLHAERIWLDKKTWYWKLKPGIKLGEVIEI